MAEIFGLQFTDLPDNHVPIEGVMLIKTLDEDGDPGLEIRSTGGLSNPEALGMFITAADKARRELADTWSDLDEQ